jgi:hypothetical protein
MLDLGRLPAVCRISKVVKHYESMCARVAEVLLRTEDSALAIVVLGKLYKSVQGRGSRSDPVAIFDLAEACLRKSQAASDLCLGPTSRLA